MHCVSHDVLLPCHCSLVQACWLRGAGGTGDGTSRDVSPSAAVMGRAVQRALTRARGHQMLGGLEHEKHQRCGCRTPSPFLPCRAATLGFDLSPARDDAKARLSPSKPQAGPTGHRGFSTMFSNTWKHFGAPLPPFVTPRAAAPESTALYITCFLQR